MKVLIIEDETAAAQNLSSILRKLFPDIEILDVIDTVVDSVEYLRTNPVLDLVFMDIHLSDGESFRIFDSVKVNSPIIFTTAYDQYALEAFRKHGIFKGFYLTVRRILRCHPWGGHGYDPVP